MARPTETLEWATDETNIVTPDPSKILSGWVPSERPAAQFFNWFMNLAGKWVQNFVDELDGDVYIPIQNLEDHNLVLDRRFEKSALQTLKLVYTNPSFTINDIAFDVNILGSTANMVAVGDDDTIVTRPQGDQWTLRTPDNGFASGFVACVGGFAGFAIVGNGGEIQTSSDAIVWTERHLLGNNFTDVTYAANTSTYCAVGLGGYIWTSTDLTTWTQRTSAFGGSVDLNAIATDGFSFVVTTGDGRVQTSNDGITWTAQSSGTLTGTSPTYLPRQLQYNPFNQNFGYIALWNRNSGEIGVSHSPDGVTWTPTTSGTATNFDEPNIRLLILSQQIVYLSTKSSSAPYSMNAIVAQDVNSRPTHSGSYVNIFDICEMWPFAAIPVNGIIFVVGRKNNGDGVIYSGAPFYAFPP